MPEAVCQVHNLGLIPYQEAWDLQNQYADEIAAGERPPTLLLLEHPHTYTFGRRGEAANLLWDAADLARRGVTVHWVDRGGDVTYHGPGQLVGYPLLPLGSPALQKVDYIRYIRKLEQVIIAAVFELGVEARQVAGLTGVWVSRETIAESRELSVDQPPRSAVALSFFDTGLSFEIAKLAAIGVKVDARGISRHGFALNIAPEMEYWEGIIGCGLSFPEISLAQLLDPVPKTAIVQQAVIRAFAQIFEFDLIPAAK